MAEQASRRLKAIQNVLAEDPATKLILPDLSLVHIYSDRVALDGSVIACFQELPRTASLAVSAVGTPYEHSNPMPKYPVIEILAPSSQSDLSPETMWITIYALFSARSAQEMIPINITNLANEKGVTEYILVNGLGRRHPRATEDLFLSRSAFWQGAGTSIHNRGWLREYSEVVKNFPTVDSFTRSSAVITSHPLRPPKPPPGALLYRRHCTTVNQMYDIHYIDINDERHLRAFHKWHNDPRINAAWGEGGTLEQHKKYIQDKMDDPRVWPVLGSWDGELMGYFELVWAKEDHISQYIPGGGQPYDRGIHLLVGEEKYRGRIRARAWFTSMVHYMYLSEPRTSRIVGEPKAENAPVIAVSIQSEFHVETEFDLPYKRSVMTDNLRERFFKKAVLT